MPTSEAATLLRGARERAGLSQRALASRAGTSSATVSQYESGRKEPRLETLERLLLATGHRLELRATPLSHRDRAEARSIALHRAIAERLVQEPDPVLERARRNLATLRSVHADGSADHWLDAWADLLDGPVDALVATLTDPGDTAHELRQNTPFAGVLSPRERWAVYRAHAA